MELRAVEFDAGPATPRESGCHDFEEFELQWPEKANRGTFLS